jgi:multidrug efflux pump subunit AcrB/outer membrane protein TolC
MSKKITFVESAMKNRQIVFLSIILLIGLGIYALKNMPRQEFPTVTIRQGLVIGAYPGATSKQVEEQLTTEVERYLFSYKEINKKKTYSYSKNGLTIIFVELNDKVKDADEFWSKLKHGLNTFKSKLPVGVLALYADNDFGDTSALLVSLEADNKSYRELETYLNRLEDRLRRIESVSKLRHLGLQNEEISIYIDKTKLEKYGINSSMITAGLFVQGLTAAGASIDYGNIETPIHIASMFQTQNDIEQQIIYSDPSGNLIRIKDIARVVREYPDPDSYIENNAHKCLLISMEMLEGNNIVQFGEEVDKVLNDFQKTLPEGVTIKRIADQPFVVSSAVSTFMLELLFAILSVIIVTMLLLPLRVASVAAASIPITIFISLGLMYIFGIELNTVTLAALIVVLGMIVDNSIVIVDSYMEKIDHGVSRWFAAISSAKVYFKAIFSATLAISITFFPFLFTLKGTFKDFVEMFPWTVTLTLGISLLVAMMIIPYLQYFFIRKGFGQPNQQKKKHFNMLDFIQRTYEKYLAKAFARPKLTLFLGFLSVLCAVALFFKVPQRLLPVAERNQFAIEIYLPHGSSLESTAQVSDSLEHLLSADNRITSITSFIGTSSPRFHTTYAPQIPAKNYAQFIVNTISNKATVALLDEYTDKYSDYFPNAHVRFKELDYQPITAPVEVRISGDSIKILKDISDTLIPMMRQIKEISWVRTDYGEMQPTIQVNVNNIEANRLGISKSTVATNLAIRYEGVPVTTLWEDDYAVTVKLRTSENKKEQNISNEYIHSLIPGISVPLRQIATVSPDWNQGQIVRRNGMPTLTILADLHRGNSVQKVFSAIEDSIETLHVPSDVQFSYGGSHEVDDENVPNIMGGLIIAIFIIFMILLLHFRKISLALLVLGSSSLSLLGAFIGVILLRVEFGITAILGIVSLIGILVRNGIIMLDYAEELREKHKLSFKEAAIEAGKRRMRPIFLTSAAASVGVIPMIISANPLWSPMGAVICFGTLTSMVMLVLILPVAYWMIFKNEDTKRPAMNRESNKAVLPALIVFFLLAGVGQQVSAQTPYTLEQCKKNTLENNYQVKNSNLEVLSAQQIKKSAFTEYFPKITATGMTYRFNEPLIKLNIPGGNLPVYDGNPVNLYNPTQFAYFPGINLSLIDKGNLGAITAIQPVFAGGRIISGNNLARVGIHANTSRNILSENQVLLSTEEQYWRIVSLVEKKQTLATAEQMLDSLYHEANDAWHAGLINRNDVLRVSLKQSEIKSSKLKLDNGIKLSAMAFCQHMGIPYDATMVLTDSLSVKQPPAEVYVNAADAVVNREEYKLLEQSVKAEKLKTRMKIGSYLPEAGVGVGAMYYDIQDKGTTNTMIFGTVSVPISDWWDGVHAIKERRYQEEITKNNSDNNKELLILQIEKTWNELNEAWQEIDVATETVNQAAENLKINKDNYGSGIINISDMLEAQTLLQQAKDMLSDAKANYRIKFTLYLQATGRYEVIPD